jgi:hypothetical protein
MTSYFNHDLARVMAADQQRRMSPRRFTEERAARLLPRRRSR